MDQVGSVDSNLVQKVNYNGYGSTYQKKVSSILQEDRIRCTRSEPLCRRDSAIPHKSHFIEMIAQLRVGTNERVLKWSLDKDCS